MNFRPNISVKTVCHAIVITSLGALFSCIFIFDFTSFSYFDVTTKSEKFRPFDFFNRVAINGLESYLSDKIVIVNTDNASREVIANALLDIDRCAPAAVGLDIIFTADNCPVDTILYEAVSSVKNLVLPVSLYYSEEEEELLTLGSFYDTSPLPGAQHGVANIDASTHLDIVRNFRNYFQIGNDSILPSLACAMAGMSGSKTPLVGDADEDKPLYMQPVDFLVLEPSEIAEFSDDIKGKFVLVGSMNAFSDLHRTPIDDNMPGIKLHAMILEQLLSGHTMKVVPQWVNWLTAFLITMIFVMYALVYNHSQTSGLFLRLLQISLIIGIAFLGSVLFIRHNIDFDFSPTLSMVTFALVSLDIYIGVITIFPRMVKYIWQKSRRLFSSKKDL